MIFLLASTALKEGFFLSFYWFLGVLFNDSIMDISGMFFLVERTRV